MILLDFHSKDIYKVNLPFIFSWLNVDFVPAPIQAFIIKKCLQDNIQNLDTLTEQSVTRFSSKNKFYIY